VISPLLTVSGVAIQGFWYVVDGLTDMELGNRCNEEWQKTLARVKRQWEFPGVTRETYLRVTENP